MNLTAKQAGAITAVILAAAVGMEIAKNTDAEAPTLSAVVWAFPQPEPGFRMNVLLNANVLVPDEVWSSPEWRAAIGESDGRFPVHLWTQTDGKWSRVDTIWLPAHRGGMQVVPVSVYGGRIVGVEDTPGLLTRPGVLPIASLIDTTSNDPTTLQPWRIEIRGADRRRPVRR